MLARGPIPTVTVPAMMNGSADATWQVSWVGGSAPYAVAWNFGNGAEPNTVSVPNAASPVRTTVTMVNPSLTEDASYIYTVVVTDALGLTGTVTAQYAIALTQNHTPVIDNTVFSLDDYSLFVHVSDPDDGETLTVNATASEGLVLDAAEKVAARSGPLTAEFQLSAADLLAGAAGEVSLTVTDGRATSAPLTVALSIPSLAQRAAADTLYAIPLDTTAKVGDEVVIVIATGVPARPFQFVNYISLTMERGAEYVDRTFDVGAPDIYPDIAGVIPVDGIWAEMNPSEGFLDLFLGWRQDGTAGVATRGELNITPIGGSELTSASGILCNFRMRFTAPGVYHLGFHEFSGVPRTYYTGADTIPRFWGDITNDHAGIPNSITVN